MIPGYSEDDFTPTQWRMLQVLKDGLPHHRDELYSCLNDDLQRKEAVNVHLCKIRKVLQRFGETIICEVRRGGFRSVRYRQVKFLHFPEPFLDSGNSLTKSPAG